jgi:hypothetical protein
MPSSYTKWEEAKALYRDDPTPKNKKAADAAFEEHRAAQQEEVKRQEYYAKNKAAGDAKAKAKDYEIFGSRGDAARKGMEEGRMDEMGTAYKKGGSVKSSASRRADGIAQRGKTRGKIC